MTRSSGGARAKQRVIKTTPSESANWTTEGEGSEPGDGSQPTEEQQPRRSAYTHRPECGAATSWTIDRTMQVPPPQPPIQDPDNLDNGHR